VSKHEPCRPLSCARYGERFASIAELPAQTEQIFPTGNSVRTLMTCAVPAWGLVITRWDLAVFPLSSVFVCGLPPLAEEQFPTVEWTACAAKKWAQSACICFKSSRLWASSARTRFCSARGLGRIKAMFPPRTPRQRQPPCLDKLLNGSGAGKVSRTDPAGRVRVLVEVLHGGDAHH
jgi:hypothetical protein